MVRIGTIGLVASLLLTAVATLLILVETVHAQRVPQHVFSGQVSNFRQPLNDGFVRVTVGPGQEVAYGDIRQGRYNIPVVEPAGGNYSGLMLRFIVVTQEREYERPSEVRWEAGRTTVLNFDIEGWRWQQAPHQQPGFQPGGNDSGRHLQEEAERQKAHELEEEMRRERNEREQEERFEMERERMDRDEERQREREEREMELRQEEQEARRDMELQQMEREAELRQEEQEERREIERERMDRDEERQLQQMELETELRQEEQEQRREMERERMERDEERQQEQMERETELRQEEQEARREMEREQMELENERREKEMEQRLQMDQERMDLQRMGRGQGGVQLVVAERSKSGPSRGLFSNKKSGEASSGIDNIMDPTTLTIIGIVLTVGTTGLTLFRGN